MNDPLLQKVIEFLIVPESILSVIFLGLFGLCFLYGFYEIFRCRQLLVEQKKTAAEKYKAECGKINEKQFMARIKADIEAREVKIDSTSNLFLMIGILGTFIGLGVAIHGASDLLNSEKIDLMQLNAVLSVIAFKFQTSVWGTLFSIIFMKFFAEPYMTSRQRLLGEIEEAVYADAVNFHKAFESGMQGLKDAQFSQLDDLHKALVGDANLHETSMKQTLTEQIGQLVAQQDDLHKTLVGDADRHAESTKQMITEQISQLVAQQDDLHKALVGDADRHAESTKQVLTEQISQLVARQEAMHQALLGDVGSNATSVKQTLAEQIDQQRRYMEEVLARQSDLNEQFSTQQMSMWDELRQNDQDNGQTLIETVASQIEQQRTHMAQLIDRQNRLNEVLLGSVEDTTKKNAQEIREGFVQQMEQYREFSSALAKEQQETQKALEMSLASLSDNLDRTSETNENSLAELRRALDILQQAIDTNSRVLNDIVIKFYDKQKALDALRRKEILGIADTFTELLQQEGKKTAPWRRDIDTQSKDGIQSENEAVATQSTAEPSVKG